MRKKIITIAIIILIIIIMFFFQLSINVNNNLKYQKNQRKEVLKNYLIKEKIININYNNFFYIITTKNNIIVLNDHYQEIFKEKKAFLAKLEESKKIIYKNNKLVYQTTEMKANQIKYTYYDAYTKEIIKEIDLRK